MDYSPLPIMVMHDLEGMPAGWRGREWPAHITVIPYFRVDASVEPDVMQVIEDVGRSIGPFELRPGALALYGTSHNVRVTELDDSTGRLHELHNKLIDQLGPIGCRFVDLRFSRANFSPHTTHTKRLAVPAGRIVCETLSIVKKLPKSPDGNRLIAKIVDL